MALIRRTRSLGLKYARLHVRQMNEFITKPRLRGKFFTSAVFVHETSFNSSAGHSENSFMQHFANLHFQNETELTKFSRLTWTYIKVILDSNCLNSIGILRLLDLVHLPKAMLNVKGRRKIVRGVQFTSPRL